MKLFQVYFDGSNCYVKRRLISQPARIFVDQIICPFTYLVKQLEIGVSCTILMNRTSGVIDLSLDNAIPKETAKGVHSGTSSQMVRLPATGSLSKHFVNSKSKVDILRGTVDENLADSITDNLDVCRRAPAVRN